MDAMIAAGSREHELVARLRLICGERHVITDRAQLMVYRPRGAVPRPRGATQPEGPVAAALPASATEVAAVLRTCHADAILVVPRGAGTAVPNPVARAGGSVLLVLSRMRRLRRADGTRGVVVAEAGVPLGRIGRALGDRGAVLLANPGDAVATVGGAVAGGMALADHVVGLEVVLADGTPLFLQRDHAGYELAGAFSGSEGTLGVVVGVHLRLAPASLPALPPSQEQPQRADSSARRRLRAALDPAGLLRSGAELVG